ncbi:MAG: 50S ribosomal protein L6 [Christensenellales bacterium]|jgi:large subunit ribosomal protein L6
MSRIGKLPIAVPAGVAVNIAGDNTVTVKGPKGELTRKLNNDMKISLEDATLTVSRPTDNKNHRALHGLTRSLLSNMVVGVTEGYQKTLELVGTGYRASVNGTELTLEIGYSHPVKFKAENGISFECPAPNRIVVRGIQKEDVGQVAANIRKMREPEPYLGKGIRYQGERIIRKEGKSGK